MDAPDLPAGAKSPVAQIRDASTAACAPFEGANRRQRGAGHN
jgi:hypothetical protein